MTRLPALLLVLLVPLAASAQSVIPPAVLVSPPAVYPPGEHSDAEVSLVVTVREDGSVAETTVLRSAGPAFDSAAVTAVGTWRFRPALRDGVPFPARIRIPFLFRAPQITSAAQTMGATQTTGAAQTTSAAPTTGAAQTTGAAPAANATSAANPPTASSTPTATVPITTAPAGSVPSLATVPLPPDRLPPGPLATGEPPLVPTPEPAHGFEEVSVRGRQKVASRGGSDFEIPIGQLAVTANAKASDLLQLAPGIFIANEAGEGHADQVFLRGFNAEQGQAIEFTVQGVPINEVDNPDGHGYADTHFVIPEVVKNLRVVEGPFDPHQGDFAVAGSANYELGVSERGLRLEGWFGSYDSRRLLALWAPHGERDGTFAAVQVWSSAGFGVNRANFNASAMAGYEGELGQRGLFRLLATSYATHYKSAGTVRADDVASGRIDFYGTEDPSQGGDAQRHSLSFDLESPSASGLLRQQVFLTFRTLRIQESFTGFLLDPQEQGQSLHPQRGDGILQSYSALTAGARGSDRLRFQLLGREQAIEAGYYARYDHTSPEVERVRFSTQIPYAIDDALQTDVMNVAAFIDLDLHPFSWLTVRGGAREEFFSYGILNLCATNGNYGRNQPLDVPCPFYDRSGARLPELRSTATGTAFSPRGSALVRLSPEWTLTGSYGVGAQSYDAHLISQDLNAPFTQLRAAEAGAIFHRQTDRWDLSARALGYWTHVDQDRLFNPQLGRLSASPGTTRLGAVGAMRATSSWLDQLGSVTWADARFDDDHALVPYVPILIARSDTAVTRALPGWTPLGHAITGTASLTLELIGSRALPFSQFAAPTFELGATASLAWNGLRLGVHGTNLLDTRYPSSQFFFPSDFHSRDYPTLVPAAQFTAAAPRTLLFTLAVLLAPEEAR